MPKNHTFVYLVEGKTEEKLVKILKEKYIVSGKIRVLHQKRLSDMLLRTISPDTTVILIFDTDVKSTIQSLELNIKKLENYKIKYILVPQVHNLEDEIVFATSIKEIKELLKSKSNKDFKRDFLNTNNFLARLENKKFNIKRFWSRRCTSGSVFSQYKNNSALIKC